MPVLFICLYTSTFMDDFLPSISFDSFGEKIYFSIGEVAEFLHLPISTLRFWESQLPEFPGFLSQKNSKGTRRYTRQNIENLHLLNFLLKKKGMTLEGAKRYILANDGHRSDTDEAMRTLLAIRQELEGQIAVYDDLIAKEKKNHD